jgi:hypothetical protein
VGFGPIEKEFKKIFGQCLDSMSTLEDLIYGNVDEYASSDPGLDRLNETLSNVQPGSNSNTHHADSERGVTFISSNDFSFPELDNEEYVESMKKVAKKSQHREPRKAYQPNIQKCEGCGSEFDFNKEYPAGRLEATSKIKCNKCRTSGA